MTHIQISSPQIAYHCFDKLVTAFHLVYIGHELPIALPLGEHCAVTRIGFNYHIQTKQFWDAVF